MTPDIQHFENLSPALFQITNTLYNKGSKASLLTSSYTCTQDLLEPGRDEVGVSAEEQRLREQALAERSAQMVLDGAAQVQERPGVSAKEALSELRKKCKNTLHLASVLLQDRMLQIFARIIFYCLKALREEHVKTIHILGTQKGAMQFHAGLAAGKWILTLATTIRLLGDEATLRRLTIITPCSFFSDEGDGLEDDCDQRKIAAQFFRMVLELVSQRVWSMALHTTCFPDAFAVIFLDDDDDVVQSGIAWIKDAWEAMLAAEVYKGPHEQFVQHVLKDVQCNQWQVNREFYVLLLRGRFDAVDDTVRWVGWGYWARKSNTKEFLENTFGHLRHEEGLIQKNKHMDPWHMYWAACRAPHLVKKEEDKDKEFPAMKLEDEDWTVPIGVPNQKVGKGAFYTTYHKPPQQLEALELMDSKTKDWKSAGPHGHWRSVGAIRLLVVDRPHGFSHLRLAWAGAFLGKGLVYLNVQSDQRFISLGFHAWAAQGWPMTKCVVGDQVGNLKMLAFITDTNIEIRNVTSSLYVNNRDSMIINAPRLNRCFPNRLHRNTTLLCNGELRD